jgi:hypothetical protein
MTGTRELLSRRLVAVSLTVGLADIADVLCQEALPDSKHVDVPVT